MFASIVPTASTRHPIYPGTVEFQLHADVSKLLKKLGLTRCLSKLSSTQKILQPAVASLEKQSLKKVLEESQDMNQNHQKASACSAVPSLGLD